jgi:hypothetical protein
MDIKKKISETIRSFPYEISQALNRCHPKRQIIKLGNKEPITVHKYSEAHTKLLIKLETKCLWDGRKQIP